jgi:hypothetical protein
MICGIRIGFAVSLLLFTAVYTAAQEAPVVRFRAVTPDGAPVANAPIFWTPYSENLRTTFPNESERSTTDAEGYCTVDFSTHPDVTGNNFEVCVEPGEGHSGILRVHPTEKKDGPTLIEVVKQIPIRGRVRAEDGTPIPGAVLGSPWFPRTTTDEDGRFTVWGLGTSGTLSVFKAGFAWNRIGFPKGEVEIVLEPGFQVTLETVDAAGNPIADADVGYQNIRLRSDAEGRVQTLPFPAGETISAYASFAREQTYLTSTAIQVTVAAGPPQVLRLVLTEPEPVPPVSISGRVVMAGTGEPIRSRIFISHSPSEFDYFADSRAETAEDGSFTLENLSRTEQFVQARPTKSTLYGQDGIVRVDCRQGSVEGLVLNVARGCAISGRVKLSDGSDPEPDWVLLSHGETVRQFYAKSGHFQFFNLPPQPATAELRQGDVSLPITLPEPGNALRDVTLELPGPSAMAHISGQVVNEQGEAQAGVSLMIEFHQTEATAETVSAENSNIDSRPKVRRQRSLEHVETDGEGRFTVETPHAGTISLKQASVMRTFTAGGDTDRRGIECTILESTAAAVVEPGGTLENLRFVIAQPETQMIAGSVRDEAGNPVDARADFITASRESVYTNGQVRNGHFQFYKLPEEKFAIEFQLEKHQARVLEEGRDFQRGNENIQVVLPTTPYPEDVPLWTTVTGAPWTPEAVDSAIQGKSIRMRFDYYRRLLDPTPQRPVPPPATEGETGPVAIQVVDPEGKPIPRITIHPAEPYMFTGTDGELGILDVVTAPNSAATVLSSDDGRYDVPVNHLIAAEGTCRQYISQRKEKTEEGPRNIILYPKHQLTVNVVNAEGGSVPDITIAPYSGIDQFSGGMLHAFPRTDHNGTVVYDDLPPGSYTLVARSAGGGPDARLVLAELTGKADASVSVMYGPYAEGSPDARLDQLRSEWRNASGNDSLVNFAPLWEGRTKKERKQLTEAARARLKAPVLADIESLPFLADLAVTAGMKNVSGDLDRHLTWLPPHLRYQSIPAVANAQALLGGNNAIPALLDRVRDATMDSRERLVMIVAINRIGTPESLAAWKNLRDQARTMPNAPQSRAEYTHAERMEEAIVLTLAATRGALSIHAMGSYGAEIAEDYTTGTIWVGGTQYTLRRVGNEWFPVTIGETYME